jgi:hypothetical protein
VARRIASATKKISKGKALTAAEQEAMLNQAQIKGAFEK